MASLRHDGRRADALRAVKITPGFLRAADGSCLMEMGRTRLICTASFVEGVPGWRAASGAGWVTAEYGMLPAATGSRKSRPLVRPDGRSVEIQRIIGRVLRNVVRFDRLGENTVYLDCDVLEADGGTRTAAITGAYVALALAARRAAAGGRCAAGVVQAGVAAVSVGLVDGRCLLDLDYQEDAAAEVDMNVAMTSRGQYVEVQGSAERAGFDGAQLTRMLTLARRGIRKLLAFQRKALAGGGRR
ncbi:MAG: ribonuclease PH [Phycisphaerae bacterium]|nr:ribonuclease PH [Phycisphaerae bacterium]